MKFVLLSNFLAIFFFGNLATADHPNEGLFGLDDLVREALAQNQEIKASTLQLEAARKEAKTTKGAFFPEISLQGGPRSTKIDAEKNSDTTLYGNIEWNLYRGGRDSAALEIKKFEVELLEKQANQSKNRIGREVARAYYEALFLLESIHLKEKALVLNDEQMKLARRKNQSGFTSSADVIEFELREATIKSDLKKIIQEKNDKFREISVLMGRGENASEITLRGHLKKDIYRVDQKKILLEMSSLNPELIQTQVDQQIAQKEKDIAMAGFLPEIDVEGKFGKIASEERVFEEKDNYSIFLKVKIPIFSGLSAANGYGAAGARSQLQNARFSQKAMSAKAEAEGLFSKLDSIRERLDLEEKTLQRSEDYYKITLGEYRRGVKNSPDMVGAAERLLEARIRNLEYRRDYLLTKIQILGLTGSEVQ